MHYFSRIKAERDEIEKPYLYASIDGRKEKIGNFRVEPPGLFRGRGEHPKKGRFKVSVITSGPSSSSVKLMYLTTVPSQARRHCHQHRSGCPRSHSQYSRKMENCTKRLGSCFLVIPLNFVSQVQHDNTVTWLAHWKENINGNSKYVFLSAGSTWKGQSDRTKFEKARELQVCPHGILAFTRLPLTSK